MSKRILTGMPGECVYCRSAPEFVLFAARCTACGMDNEYGRNCGACRACRECLRGMFCGKCGEPGLLVSTEPLLTAEAVLG